MSNNNTREANTKGGRPQGSKNKKPSLASVKEATPEMISSAVRLIHSMEKEHKMTPIQKKEYNRLLGLIEQILDAKSIKQVMSLRKQIVSTQSEGGSSESTSTER